MAQHTLIIDTGIIDAYRKSGNEAMSNTGQLSYLKIGDNTSTSEYYKSFIKFPITSIPAGKNIISAKLYLYITDIIASTSYVRIRQAIADWGEDTIALLDTSFPYSPGEYVDVAANDSSIGSYFAFNILSILNTWSTSPNYGVWIGTTGSNNMVTANSFQADTNKPYVEIVYEDVPPTAPTGLYPSSGTIIDRFAVNRFSWNTSTPATSSVFEWSVDGSTWNAVTISNSNNYYDVPSETFPLGSIYWRVKFTDSQPVESSYSYQSIITSTQKPNAPAITSSSTITIASPTLTWTSSGQLAFQVHAYYKEPFEAVFGSELIIGSANEFTLPFQLQNGRNYIFYVRIQDGSGFWSEWSGQEVSVEFPIPPKPTITLTASANGGVKIQIANPSGEPTNDELQSNDLYKRVSGSEWKRVKNGIAANVTLYDYALISGQTYEYKVAANGVLGGYADSDSASIIAEIRNPVLSLPDGTFLAEVKFNLAREERINLDGTQMIFAGRQLQVTEYSEHINTELAIQFSVNSATNLDTIRNLVKTKQIMLYRDRYRAMYCTTTSITIKDRMKHKVWDVNLILSETSYEEET